MGNALEWRVIKSGFLSVQLTRWFVKVRDLSKRATGFNFFYCLKNDIVDVIIKINMRPNSVRCDQSTKLLIFLWSGR